MKSDRSAECLEIARRARQASQRLALCSTSDKNRYLVRAADALLERQQEILQANALDLSQARDNHLTPAQVDRLRLTPDRIASCATGLREVAAMADPIGQIRESRTRPNGLEIHKVGVPLGVIFFLYESRPNVTVDAAGLSVKSGNALILRGGKEALASNTALHRILQENLEPCHLPSSAVQLVSNTDRAMVGHLLQLDDWINLVIPRGGESLIRRVTAEARMPVLKHYKGICHVYVEKSADPELALRIAINSKCQRPGVCNAAETILIDAALASHLLPILGQRLQERGVEIRGCAETCRQIPGSRPATSEDYATEYLDLIVSLRVVRDQAEAMEHIQRYSSGHTETIVTTNLQAAREFTRSVDSSCVLVNASTRFNDGQELGLGAEIGISTDKFHARGPCGLIELTSYKFVVFGDGQIRGES